MAFVQRPGKCPHEAFWFADCDPCADTRVIFFLRQKLGTSITVEEIIRALQAGEHYDVAPPEEVGRGAVAAIYGCRQREREIQDDICSK